MAWEGTHWLIRSRHHAHVGIDPEHIAIGKRAVKKGGFEQYADICGRVLALTHSRGDRRSTLFEQRASKLVPKVADELSETLRAYVELVNEDRAYLAELKRRCDPR